MRLTVVIPSFQRRGALERLLRALDDQAPPDMDVVVVVDGSTDGTVEMLRDLHLGVPVRVLVQENRGQGSARNAGFATVDHDGVVWFLDDDMVPSEGLAATHQRAHVDAAPRIVMGPCLFPADFEVVRANRVWADQVYETLSASGRVEDPTLFSVANTSAPVSLWQQLGGFHEGFAGWGAEDHELGVRAIQGGIAVEYLPQAIAWHLQERDVVGMCRTKEQEGANRVRLVRLHPEEADAVFPVGPASKWAHRFRFLGHRPRATRAFARVLARAAEVERRVLRSSNLLRPAVVASVLAGVAAEDASGVCLRWLTHGRDAGDLPPSTR